MTGYDSKLYCPHCSGGPALYVRVVDGKRMRAECPICVREYTLERDGDGYRMTVTISMQELLGANVMTVLKLLVRSGRIPDAHLDKETRRQMQKLAALGLVRSVVQQNSEKGKEVFWEPTRKALSMVGWS